MSGQEVLQSKRRVGCGGPNISSSFACMWKKEGELSPCREEGRRSAGLGRSRGESAAWGRKKAGTEMQLMALWPEARSPPEMQAAGSLGRGMLLLPGHRNMMSSAWAGWNRGPTLGGSWRSCGSEQGFPALKEVSIDMDLGACAEMASSYFSREAPRRAEGVHDTSASCSPTLLVRPYSIRKQLFCAPTSPSLSLRRTLALGMETRQIFHIPLCPVMFKNVRDGLFQMLQTWLALKQ